MPLVFDHVAIATPDIAATVRWHLARIPGAEVLHQDATWAIIAAGGSKLAFVTPGDHPPHVAYRVDDAELERLASEYGGEIRGHRDGTRSFYMEAPGGNWVEIIAYP